MLVSVYKGCVTMHGITSTRLSAPFGGQFQVLLIDKLIAMFEDESRQSFFLKYLMLVNCYEICIVTIFFGYFAIIESRKFCTRTNF